MTRGNFVLVNDGKIYISCQFNGDMYPDGHGTTVYALLGGVDSVEKFEAAVEAFRAVYFPEYEGTGIHEVSELDFSKDYYKNFGSDYLYIKNIGSNSAVIISKDNGDVKDIAPGEIQVWEFGRLRDIDFESMAEMKMFKMMETSSDNEAVKETTSDNKTVDTTFSADDSTEILIEKCRAKIDAEYQKSLGCIALQPGYIVMDDIESYAALKKAYKTFSTLLMLAHEKDRPLYEKILKTKNPLHMQAVDYIANIDHEFEGRMQVTSVYRSLLRYSES